MEYNKIIDEIQNIVNSRLSNILDEISQDYNLDNESLKNKYILQQINRRRGRKKKLKINLSKLQLTLLIIILIWSIMIIMYILIILKIHY